MRKTILTKEALDEILANAGRGGKTYKELATKFGVHVMTINAWANPGLREKSKKAKKKYREANKDKVHAIQRAYNQKLKVSVLNHYKRTNELMCECCGERHVDFLSIDHINKDGAEHRRKIKMPMYQWLKRENFPEMNVRVLCMNCNHAYGHYNKCPHQT